MGGGARWRRARAMASGREGRRRGAGSSAHAGRRGRHGARGCGARVEHGEAEGRPTFSRSASALRLSSLASAPLSGPPCSGGSSSLAVPSRCLRVARSSRRSCAAYDAAPSALPPSASLPPLALRSSACSSRRRACSRSCSACTSSLSGLSSRASRAACQASRQLCSSACACACRKSALARRGAAGAARSTSAQWANARSACWGCCSVLWACLGSASCRQHAAALSRHGTRTAWMRGRSSLPKPRPRSPSWA